MNDARMPSRSVLLGTHEEADDREYGDEREGLEDVSCDPDKTPPLRSWQRVVIFHLPGRRETE
jgi:hypothetical protein